MSSETTNKAVIHRLVEVLSTGDLSNLDEIFREGYLDHTSAEAYDPSAAPAGIEGSCDAVEWLHATFSGPILAMDHLVAEGDKVMCFWTCTGAHSRDFLGVAPTGKAVTFSAATVDRFEEGKIVESWGVHDLLGVALQIGAIPAEALQS